MNIFSFFLDNTETIQYLAKMGGRKPLLNKLAREIWLWCEVKKFWLSMYHIPGKLNKTADGLSRMTGKLSDGMEWSLNSAVFKIIERKMGKCYIDLFASSNNFKSPKYVHVCFYRTQKQLQLMHFHLHGLMN